MLPKNPIWYSSGACNIPAAVDSLVDGIGKIHRGGALQALLEPVIASARLNQAVSDLTAADAPSFVIATSL